MGTASVSIVLPEIIEACPDRDMVIFRLGTSGGLKKYLNVGDVVVTDDVERRELTSDYALLDHMPIGTFEARASADARQALIEAAKANAIGSQKIYSGRTRVVSEIYNEGRRSRRNADAEHASPEIAVSMEFSTICAYAKFYELEGVKDRIRTGNLLMISDNLVVGEGDIVDASEFHENKDRFEAMHIKAGLEALVKLRREL